MSMYLASARKAPSDPYHVSPDVDVFHFLALAFSNEIKDVKVLEISTELVSEIDAVGWVAACCSPVGGVSL